MMARMPRRLLRLEGGVAAIAALALYFHEDYGLGVDRLLGYGLKYPTAFRDTHLQRV